MPDTSAPLKVLVYSDDPAVRASLRAALGQRLSADLGRLEHVEAATGQQVLDVLDDGGVDLAVLDGEAQPTGGMGLCRQLKNEIADCPPILIAVARHDDRWLARWSLADGVVVHPLDAVTTAEIATGLLRGRVAGDPVRRVPARS